MQTHTTPPHHHHHQDQDQAAPPGTALIPTSIHPTGPRLSSPAGPQAGQDDEVDERGQARLWSTHALRQLVDNLRPYVDGTLGEVSPRHAAVQVTAIRELNRLWSAYYVQSLDGPRIDMDENAEEVERERGAEQARITRARVLDQLEQLRGRDPIHGA